ncbi:hypothetical protein GCM10011594_44220 [Nakamurella endophytica]|uniref:Uncharacterized protein n=1 Tax=Nakamurella endophytica TaxID=1748367 RepID=A0A917TE00_9ACTN|nr:hypothetical protein GCM10011594_44220 [Nakamurella endophytica]
MLVSDTWVSSPAWAVTVTGCSTDTPVAASAGVIVITACVAGGLGMLEVVGVPAAEAGGGVELAAGRAAPSVGSVERGAVDTVTVTCEEDDEEVRPPVVQAVAVSAAVSSSDANSTRGRRETRIEVTLRSRTHRKDRSGGSQPLMGAGPAACLVARPAAGPPGSTAGSGQRVCSSCCMVAISWVWLYLIDSASCRASGLLPCSSSV